MGLTVNKYVKPTFEGRRIRTLTADEFEDWMAEIVRQRPATEYVSKRRSPQLHLTTEMVVVRLA